MTTAQKPPHSYEWIKPEDAIRHALAAFYTACRFHDEAWRAWGTDAATSRRDWVDDFLNILSLRVNLQAETAGVEIEPDSAEYLAHYTNPYWSPEVIQAAKGEILSVREFPEDIHCRVSFKQRPDRRRICKSPSCLARSARIRRIEHCCFRRGFAIAFGRMGFVERTTNAAAQPIQAFGALHLCDHGCGVQQKRKRIGDGLGLHGDPHGWMLSMAPL